MSESEQLWDDEKALKRRAMAVYILYLAAMFTFGVTAIIGVVLAQFGLPQANRTFVQSHFENQIRAFWVTAIICAAGFVSYLVLIGFLLGWVIFLIAGLWMIYRSVYGLLHLVDNKAI
ncbi:MAG: hypothetical protein AAGF58_09905 [Pseudomonadota bacterium]